MSMQRHIAVGWLAVELAASHDTVSCAFDELADLLNRHAFSFMGSMRRRWTHNS
jgi:hypothetical protein